MKVKILALVAILCCAASTIAAQETVAPQSASSQAKAVDETSPDEKLLACVKSGDVDCVKHALAAGADVNADDEEKNGNGLVLNLALRQEDKRLAQALIESGANINQHEKQTGDTPLMMVATRGDVFWTRELISRSAEIDAEDDGGHTALWTATAGAMAAASPQLIGVMFPDGDMESLKFGSLEKYVSVIKILLDAGADPNHVAHDCGQTPFFNPAISGNVAIVKLLLERGAKAEEKSPLWTEFFASEKKFAESLRQSEASEAEKKAMREWFKATNAGRKEVKRLIIAAKGQL